MKMVELDTFPKYLLNNCRRWGDARVAIRKKEFGIWQTISWKEWYEKVRRFSLGLMSLGLTKGDHVAILGDNDPEWYCAELAAQAAGAVVSGIFTDAAQAEVKYIIEHSDSKFAVVKDQEQVDKLLYIKDELPNLTRIVYWDPKGLRHYRHPILIDFEEVEDLGKKFEEKEPGLFERRIEEGNGEDTAVVLYTSGTGGAPKGAILSYRNMIAAGQAWLEYRHLTENDEWVSFTPMAWIPEQEQGFAMLLPVGCIINFPERPETVQEDIREISPTILGGGPRIWQSYCTSIQARMTSAGLAKRMCYKLFLNLGYRIFDMKADERRVGLPWRAASMIGEWVLFRPLRDNLGLRRIKYAHSGGAPLGADVFRFFAALGVDIKQIYGGTEPSGTISSHRDRVKLESSGQPLPSMEVRISTEGEILVRGDNVFKGYYKDPETTAMSLVNGWFRTGDAGMIDEDGHVICVDRLKDVMTLMDGTKYSPSSMETRLKFSPYIADAVVIGGSDRPYVTALIEIDFENVAKWAEKHSIAYTTFTDLSQKPQVYKLVQEDVQRVNQVVPRIARIRRFGNLYKQLDPDEAELTRTRKLRRGFFEDRYPELVDSLYGDKEEIAIEDTIKYSDGRTGKLRTTFRIQSILEMDNG